MGRCEDSVGEDVYRSFRPTNALLTDDAFKATKWACHDWECHGSYGHPCTAKTGVDTALRVRRSIRSLMPREYLEYSPHPHLPGGGVGRHSRSA